MRLHVFQRIVYDVSANGVQFAFVAHDVFVIPALPERCAGGVAHFVDPAGRERFERPHDFRQAVAFGRGFGRRGRGRSQTCPYDGGIVNQYNDPVYVIGLPLQFEPQAGKVSGFAPGQRPAWLVSFSCEFFDLLKQLREVGSREAYLRGRKRFRLMSGGACLGWGNVGAKVVSFGWGKSSYQYRCSSPR